MTEGAERLVLCKGCATPLREVQVQQQLGNPTYNEWCREGYCSFPCFEKNHLVRTNITTPFAQSETAGAERKPQRQGMGLPQTIAEQSSRPAASRREIGQKNMVAGGFWCIGGILVTTIT